VEALPFVQCDREEVHGPDAAGRKSVLIGKPGLAVVLVTQAGPGFPCGGRTQAAPVACLATPLGPQLESQVVKGSCSGCWSAERRSQEQAGGRLRETVRRLLAKVVRWRWRSGPGCADQRRRPYRPRAVLRCAGGCRVEQGRRFWPLRCSPLRNRWRQRRRERCAFLLLGHAISVP